MKNPSRRNRILTYYKEDRDRLSTSICYVDRPVSVNDICGKVICGDTFAVAEQLPRRFVDLLILDPPYNLDSVWVRLATFTEASTWSCFPLRHSRSVRVRLATFTEASTWSCLPLRHSRSVRVRLATFTEASTWSCSPLRHSRSVLSGNPGGACQGHAANGTIW